MYQFQILYGCMSLLISIRERGGSFRISLFFFYSYQTIHSDLFLFGIVKYYAFFKETAFKQHWELLTLNKYR